MTESRGQQRLAELRAAASGLFSPVLLDQPAQETLAPSYTALLEAEVLELHQKLEAAEGLAEALKAASEVMEYMGDIMNGMDIVQPEDEDFATPRFEKVNAALAAWNAAKGEKA